ncbi:hypothetical protein F511_45639 [Dorcoceras hygrometricum]|uniref:Uncharacterized protein n=1 Tax=Dorcoceras hygrometricum TaxID=472368 RepID=A0A2Z6ZVE7_9LAMI|nr:hypothetical protein F511_45639 [Dorcoceras hygrometricum]
MSIERPARDMRMSIARPARDGVARDVVVAAARGGGPATCFPNFVFRSEKLKIRYNSGNIVLIRSKNLGSDTTVGIRSTPPGEAAEEQKSWPGDDQYDKNNNIL